jgi:hypothetical protein
MSGIRSFIWAFIAVGLSIGAWSIATPLGSAPDEPTHIIQAAAAVRGQLYAHQVPLTLDGLSLGKVGVVSLPAWVTDVPNLSHLPDVPTCTETACTAAIGQSGAQTGSGNVLTGTQFSDYPPLYYLIVGIPTLVATRTGALYGMRFTGALLDSALIALGLFLLARYHPRRLPLLGALIALSPMVLFVGAVVSSSGMETAAGFAAWCGGLCLAARHDVPRTLAIWTVLAFVLLTFSRPLSPIHVVVIFVVLAVMAGGRRVRDPNLRPVWITTLAGLGVAGVMLVVTGVPALLVVAGKPSRPLSFASSVWLTVRLTGSRLRECVGNFGWRDVPVAAWIVGVWAVAVGGLIAFGAAALRWRGLIALGLLIVAVLAMPVILETPRMNTIGPYWEGRYWLPLVVGVPLVGSAIGSRRSRPMLSPPLRRFGLVGVVAVLLVAQVVAFVATLRHYVDLAGRWTPPGGSALPIALFVAGQVLLIGFLITKYRAVSGGEHVA